MNETEVHQQVLEGIELICFDLFGTLVEITDRRRPFASLRRNMALDTGDFVTVLENGITNPSVQAALP